MLKPSIYFCLHLDRRQGTPAWPRREPRQPSALSTRPHPPSAVGGINCTGFLPDALTCAFSMSGVLSAYRWALIDASGASTAVSSVWSVPFTLHAGSSSLLVLLARKQDRPDETSKLMKEQEMNLQIQRHRHKRSPTRPPRHEVILEAIGGWKNNTCV